MSTAAIARKPFAEVHSTSLKPLVWLEIRRFARHPVFLAGVASCTLVLFIALREAIGDPTNDRIGAAAVALFVGLFSVLAAYLLTRSMNEADEILEATPTARPTRTAALCATCGVSALFATAFGVFGIVSLRVWPMPAWLWGTFSETDMVLVVAQQSVVAAVGGTLLGVAAGRWWRFRGAGFVLLLALTVWVFATATAAALLPAAGVWSKLARAFSPVTFFQEAGMEINPDAVDTFAGSPGWYLMWLLALCALAAIAALLHGAEGLVRARLLRLGPALLATAAVFLVLAVTQGPQHVVRSFPDGTTTVITSR
ncbi:MAG: hypothetical protein ABIP19_09630 [Dermatophilaceae bacterium]